MEQLASESSLVFILVIVSLHEFKKKLDIFCNSQEFLENTKPC